MNEEERYAFDVQGYLVVKNAVEPAALAEMNAWLDTQPDKDPAGRGTIRGHNMLTWGPQFRALLDNPRVLPYLIELMGDTLRLDHDYAIFSEKADADLHLHGGGTPYDPAQYYHSYQGRMYCGLTVASYALTTIAPGDGGFCCVPGSHKAAFRRPATVGLDHPLVTPVPMDAGDCIIFTEALTHGTLPWRADHKRRSLFYKYSPKHLTWASRYYFVPEGNADVQALDAGELTETQRILLDPPSVFKHRSVTGEQSKGPYA